MFNLKIVEINPKYCDYLRKYDYRVPYNNYAKKHRPFVGILFQIEDIEYFAPLASPKKKHLKMKNNIDFLKLKNGKLGAINFNNMIPVSKENYQIVNLNNSNDKYISLLVEQLTWINAHKNQIKNKSYRLYKLYTKNKISKNIKERCCNYLLLEDKCKKYNKKLVQI